MNTRRYRFRGPYRDLQGWHHLLRDELGRESTGPTEQWSCGGIILRYYLDVLLTKFDVAFLRPFWAGRRSAGPGSLTWNERLTYERT